MSTSSATLIPASPSLLARSDLHGYQQSGVDFILDTPRCALWMEMGLGKTATVLTALVDLTADFSSDRILIIGPKPVAENTWPTEISRWEHTQHLDHQVLTGGAKARDRKRREPATIHIINRENISWLVNAWGSDWPYDTVVIDEASTFKNASTQRFKALKKALPKIRRMIQLTGTPCANSLLDLWAQMFLLDDGERLGKTLSRYKYRYFESDYMGYRWTPRRHSEEKIRHLCRDITVTMRAQDYLELPNLVVNDIAVPLKRSDHEQYLDLEKQFLLQLEETVVVAINAASLTGKLLQYCNGALYDEAGDWHSVHDVKLQALDSIVEEACGAPILIAYNFRSDLDRLKERYKNLRVLNEGDLNQNISDFNAGKIQILAAQPASCGHGLNLQGGNILVWFSLPWSLELYQQTVARLHRQGQTRTVFVHRLITPDTVEESVAEALAHKDMTQARMLDGLKAKAEERTR